MLVLTRRPDESIVIGDDAKVKVKVLSVRGYQVRLGIEAPNDVAVHREEIFLRLEDAKKNGIKFEGNIFAKDPQKKEDEK